MRGGSFCIFFSLDEMLAFDFFFLKKILQRGNAVKLRFRIYLMKIVWFSFGKWVPNVPYAVGGKISIRRVILESKLDNKKSK